MDFKRLECSEEAILNLSRMYSSSKTKSTETKLRKSKLKLLTEGLTTLRNGLGSMVTDLSEYLSSNNSLEVYRLEDIINKLSSYRDLVSDLTSNLNKGGNSDAKKDC